MAFGMIYGLIGLPAEQYRKMKEFDKEVTFEAVQAFSDLMTEQATRIANVFVDDSLIVTPTQVKELHGSGELDIVRSGAEFPEIDRIGDYANSFPLQYYGNRIAITDIDYAKMNVQQFDTRVSQIGTRYSASVVNEALRALFRNTTYTFADDYFGSLTVKPLANGDGTPFPASRLNPASSYRTTLNAYTVTENATLRTSDIAAGYAYLADTYGDMTGGAPVVAFVNPLMAAQIKALDGFVAVNANVLSTSNDSEYLTEFQDFVGTQGRTLGYVEDVVIHTWSKMPNGYVFYMYAGADKPIGKRIDEEPELGQGSLQIVATQSNLGDPTVFNWIWRSRFGYGVSNRLNGFIQQVKASGTYDIPTFTN